MLPRLGRGVIITWDLGVSSQTVDGIRKRLCTSTPGPKVENSVALTVILKSRDDLAARQL